jgi:hypothetical protein
MEDGRGVDRPSLYVPTMKKLMTHRLHLMFGLLLCAGLIAGFWS